MRGHHHEIELSRRQFLVRTGALGAAATLTMHPSLARALGPLDPLVDDVAAPALRLLARDTICGLVVFQLPGADRYSQAQGVTSDRPGGIDAKAPETLLADLDDFLPIPESYGQALAAALSTGVSEVPLPGDPLGPLTAAGESAARRMDDALRALVRSDSAVPLSLVIALVLNLAATRADPTSVAGAIPASPFASLSFADKARAFELIERGDAELVALLDGGVPEPLRASVSGLLKFVGGALLEFASFTSWVETGVFDTQTGTLTGRPVGWDLSNYMPGRLVASDGWDELKGYVDGRTSVATDPAVLAGGA